MEYFSPNFYRLVTANKDIMEVRVCGFDFLLFWGGGCWVVVVVTGVFFESTQNFNYGYC